ncbi:hypothetical protein PUF88_04520 [Lactobacillaceae bacterium L1_55_11]|nr:hypothetical protein [Lactobacillaceae bacterium L1_55_11]
MKKDLKNNPTKYWSLVTAATIPAYLATIGFLPPAKTPLGHAFHFLLWVGLFALLIYSFYKYFQYLKAAKKSKGQAK